MERFKAPQFNTPEGNPGSSRVVKVEAPFSAKVAGFQFQDLRKQAPSYAEVKAKYGSLAPTDPERSSRSQRDKRFELNELIRDSLSVEEEEQRQIEKKAQERIAALQDEARKIGTQQGFDAGYQKGREEALAEFREQGADHLRMLESLLAEVEGAKESLFRANEKLVQELVFRACRNILLRELSADKDYVARLTRELVERVGGREFIKIRINPADIDNIGKIQESVLAAIGRLKNVSIEPSEGVRGGGCEIETEWSLLDASVNTQLDRLHQELNGVSETDREEQAG